MSNPYILLRVLVLVDLALFTACMYLPVFRERSLLEFFDGWGGWDAHARVYNLLWFAANAVTVAAWLALLLVRPVGRWLYLAGFLLFLATAMAGGIGYHGRPLLDGALYLAIAYSGFLIAMLWFGRVAQLFARRTPTPASGG